MRSPIAPAFLYDSVTPMTLAPGRRFLFGPPGRRAARKGKGAQTTGRRGGDEADAGFLLPAMLPTATVPGTDVAGFSSFDDSIGHVVLILMSRMHITRE